MGDDYYITHVDTSFEVQSIRIRATMNGRTETTALKCPWPGHKHGTRRTPPSTLKDKLFLAWSNTQ